MLLKNITLVWERIVQNEENRWMKWHVKHFITYKTYKFETQKKLKSNLLYYTKIFFLKEELDFFFFKSFWIR